MRLILAFKCFFRVLFGRPLPAEVATFGLLPAPEPMARAIEVTPVERRALPEAAGPGPSEAAARPSQADGAGKAQEQEAKAQAAQPPGQPAFEAATPAQPPTIDPFEVAKSGALHMLGLLQREGRLIDFLQEQLDAYSDAQIGAAVRDIHKGCREALQSYLPLEPVMPGHENAPVQIDGGFDPNRVRLVGNVQGTPPFRGVLKHHGWRTREIKLPPLPSGVDLSVIAPAEVELT